ncbi:IS66 family insertion sequence element accessory protein TnpB [Mesorhizobium sp. M1380]|uniref:IS66 family insertion sequence element accessory protein TnpB n=1 Tax=Mesorhizobium sp. M1380 TaxID=2957093 RepID=UPI003336E59D
MKVHLALDYTDMRKGLDGLAMLVQQTLKQDPFSGHLFAFRGEKASMLKILFWDGNGLCRRRRFCGSRNGERDVGNAQATCRLWAASTRPRTAAVQPPELR